jgi:hypothetical protein
MAYFPWNRETPVLKKPPAVAGKKMSHLVGEPFHPIGILGLALHGPADS